MGIYDEPDLYCAAFAPPNDADVDAVLRRVASPRSLLEPFCGHARLARPIAARGLEYVGLDATPEIAARAPRGERITVVVGDARDFDLDVRPRAGFDLAWCPVNSLCHLTDTADVVAHLRAMRRHVADDGAYLVELEIYDRAESTEDSEWSVEHPSGGVVEAAWRCRDVDRGARTRQETGTFRHVVDGEVVSEMTERFTMRMWTYADLLGLPREAGWTVDPVCLRQGPDGVEGQAALGRHVENSGRNWTFVLRPLQITETRSSSRS
ncbi:MAG: class I SAM-dependent methyltransferase [Planctomycetota bacterium]